MSDVFARQQQDEIKQLKRALDARDASLRAVREALALKDQEVNALSSRVNTLFAENIRLKSQNEVKDYEC